MKILIVGSINNHGGQLAPFILEQAQALRVAGCDIEFFGVNGHGIRGYLREIPRLRRAIRSTHPDILHAHYGLCGLFACFAVLSLRFRSKAFRTPLVVSTFHGSDINDPKVRPLSRLAMFLSDWSIFVSQRNVNLAHAKRHYSLIPCGIDIDTCNLDEHSAAHIRKVLQPDQRHILFAGALDNAVKDPELAQAVIAHIPNAQLIELRGYTRAEVTALMHACDVLLMTSHTEGSPQVIKEAMACGLPIVSVDVGDVAERIGGLEGCYVAKTREVDELVTLLTQALALPSGFRTQGRERILQLGLTNSQVAQQLMKIYNNILDNENYFCKCRNV